MKMNDRVYSMIVNGIKSKHMEVTPTDINGAIIYKVSKLSKEDIEILYKLHKIEIDAYVSTLEKFKVNMKWCNNAEKKVELAFGLCAALMVIPYFGKETVYLDELIQNMIKEKTDE